MSACLFTVSNKWFQEASRAEIEAAALDWDKVCVKFLSGEVDTSSRFEMDRYSGYNTNSERAFYVLLGMEKNKNE